MPFVTTDYCCMIEIRLTASSQYVENVLYFNRTAPQQFAEIRTLADRMADWWYNVVAPLQRDTTVMRYVYATDISAPDGYTYPSYKRANQIGGVSGGETLPNNVSLCLSFRTNFRGRSRRGRNYAIGLGTTHVTNDYVDQTVVNNWTAAYAALLPGGAWDPTPYRWCVVSRWADHQLRDFGLKSSVQSVYAVSRRVASARKRLPGPL
jgi:hypothetical protein